MPSLELVISFSISARHSATQAAMAGGRVGAAVALRAESAHRRRQLHGRAVGATPRRPRTRAEMSAHAPSREQPDGDGEEEMAKICAKHRRPHLLPSMTDKLHRTCLARR